MHERPRARRRRIIDVMDPSFSIFDASRPPVRLPPMQRLLLALFIVVWCLGLALLLVHSAMRR
ncbi:MAG: hypothetical protein JWN44_5285 [Myxococcales bacterium]|nr:hypothetical protein [Myxococcales bacterium]